MITARQKLTAKIALYGMTSFNFLPLESIQSGLYSPHTDSILSKNSSIRRIHTTRLHGIAA